MPAEKNQISKMRPYSKSNGVLTFSDIIDHYEFFALYSNTNHILIADQLGTINM